jgi:Na+/proline symporter
VAADDVVVSWKHLMALNIVWYFGVFAAAGASYYVVKADSNSALNSHDSTMRLMTFEMKRMMMWIGVIAFVVVAAAVVVAMESFDRSDSTMQKRNCYYYCNYSYCSVRIAGMNRFLGQCYYLARVHDAVVET